MHSAYSVGMHLNSCSLGITFGHMVGWALIYQNLKIQWLMVGNKFLPPHSYSKIVNTGRGSTQSQPLPALHRGDKCSSGIQSQAGMHLLNAI